MLVRVLVSLDSDSGGGSVRVPNGPSTLKSFREGSGDAGDLGGDRVGMLWVFAETFGYLVKQSSGFSCICGAAIKQRASLLPRTSFFLVSVQPDGAHPS